MGNSVDRTLIDGGFWDRATFTVPDDTPDERVKFVADKYQAKFGNYLEGQGFTVKEMLKPQVSVRKFPTAPDRRRYDIFAFVTREPVELTVMVPEILIPEMQLRGLKLK